MLLLALDTSTPTVTAGVVSLPHPHEMVDAGLVDAGPAGRGPANPATLVAERSATDSFGHAELLVPLIREALTAAGRDFADLDAVVVGLGPGPFTGLRVGIATAQALGDGLDLPVHGVGSHDAAARAHLSRGPQAQAFLVVTDARRREVYLSAYSSTGTRLVGPMPVAPAAVAGVLADAGVRPGWVIGAGSRLLADLPGARVDQDAHGSVAVGLVLAAARQLLTGVVPGPLTPLYLRRPDATEPGTRKSVLGP